MAQIRIRSALQVLVVVLLGASPAAAQSFGSIFTTLPADFGHLFTPASAIVLGVGGAASAAVHPRDEEITARLAADVGARARIFRLGAPIGDSPEQAAFALAVYIAGRSSGHAELTATGVDLVQAQIVNGVLTQGLKFSVNRTRPNGGRHAFPSGHASASFATATVIHQHYGWKLATPFYAIGTYVGVSRMVNRKHFVSDVIFGAAVGITSGRAASFGHGAHRVAVSPSIVPGGFMFTGTVGSRQ